MTFSPLAHNAIKLYNLEIYRKIPVFAKAIITIHFLHLKIPFAKNAITLVKIVTQALPYPAPVAMQEE